jgi:hypothetical protein
MGFTLRCQLSQWAKARYDRAFSSDCDSSAPIEFLKVGYWKQHGNGCDKILNICGNLAGN